MMLAMHAEAPDRTTLTTTFRALAHPTRRHILAEIDDDDDRAEYEPADFLDGADDRDERRVALHHTHLPKLDDAGFVDWDDETGTVTRGPKYGEIRPVLSLLEANKGCLPGDWP